LSRNRNAQTPRIALFKAVQRMWVLLLQIGHDKKDWDEAVDIALNVDPSFPEHYVEVRGKVPTRKDLRDIGTTTVHNLNRWTDETNLRPFRQAARRLALTLIVNGLAHGFWAYSEAEIESLIAHHEVPTDADAATSFHSELTA